MYWNEKKEYLTKNQFSGLLFEIYDKYTKAKAVHCIITTVTSAYYSYLKRAKHVINQKMKKFVNLNK